MLCLSIFVGESFRIRVPNGPDIWVNVSSCDRGRARLGIEAPREVEIMRKELIPRPTGKPKGTAAEAISTAWGLMRTDVTKT